MADYYSLLARAVGALPQSTPEARNAVYERARKALFNQLRNIQPPVAEADIAAEGRALDEAIARLELEIAGEAQRAAAQQQAAPAKAAEGPAKQPPAASGKPAPSDKSAPAEKPAPADKPAPAVPPPKPAPPPAAGPVPQPADKAAGVKALAAAWFGALKNLKKKEAPSAAGAPAASDPSREPQRPAAPLPNLPESLSSSRRLMGIAAVLIALVGLVALAAWRFRERPEDLARLKPEDAATDSAGGKFSDRVGPDGEEGQTVAAGRVAPENAAQAVPVAQKAELWVASLQEPDKVEKIYSGNVIWRLDNVGNPGERLGSAIRGDADFPDGKMKLSLIFRKNTDATLSASHTINVAFKVQPGSDLKGVKAIGPIQMRRPDAQSGEKVVGIPVPITDNNFLIGLMRGDREARNLSLMRTLGVVDLPMQLSDGRAATISLEKGAGGERVFVDAIETWGRK